MNVFTWSIIITVIICGGLLLLQVGEGEDLSLPPSPTDCDYLVIQMAEKRIVDSHEYKYGDLKEKLIADGIKVEYGDIEPWVQSRLPAEQAIYKANYYRRMFNWNEAPPMYDVLQDYGKVPDYAEECYQH